MRGELGRLATLNILSHYQLYKYFILNIFSHLKTTSYSVPPEITTPSDCLEYKNTYMFHIQPGIVASVLMLLEVTKKNRLQSTNKLHKRIAGIE